MTKKSSKYDSYRPSETCWACGANEWGEKTPQGGRYCKPCNRRKSKEYREKNREYVRKRQRAIYYRDKEKYQQKSREHKVAWAEFLKEKSLTTCEKCGFSGNFAAIDFHHVGEKDIPIAQLLSYAYTEKNKERLLKEVKKCEVLCANCHRVLHFGEVYHPEEEEEDE